MFCLPAYALFVSTNVMTDAITRKNLDPKTLTPIGGKIIEIAHKKLQDFKPDPKKTDIMQVGPKCLMRLNCLAALGIGTAISKIENVVSAIGGGQITPFEKDVEKFKITVDEIIKHEKLDEAAAKECQNVLDRGLELFNTAKEKLQKLQQTMHSSTQQIEKLNKAMEQIPPQVMRIREKINNNSIHCGSLEQFNKLMKQTEDTLNKMSDRVNTAIDKFNENADTIAECTDALVKAMAELEKNWSDGIAINSGSPEISCY